MGRIGRMLLVLVGATACSTPQIGDGGNDQTPGGTGGGAGGADAAPADPVDDLPATADAAPEVDDDCYRGPLRRLELLDAAATTSGTAPDNYVGLTAAIDGVPVGIFYLDLYGGIGSLAGGVVPGAYPIQGDDAVWSTCAVCAWASFGVSESTWVMAQSGTVTIDRVDTRLAGSVANLDLIEIDDQDAPVPGGCEALVTGITFDVPID